VTITGGKLTTYRRMAADTVDAVQRRLDTKPTRSPTKHLALLGGDDFTPGPPTNEPSLHEHLAGRYGTEASAVLQLVAADPSLDAPLVPGLPYVRAEAVHAVRAEMARTVDDVLSRRTRARLLARDASAAAAGDVARLLAPELGWDDAEVERQAATYRALVDAERDAAHELPVSPALDACG
jgi:glycerol-3-phosphate dehydrogenase